MSEIFGEKVSIRSLNTQILNPQAADRLYGFTKDALDSLGPTSELTEAQSFSLLVGMSGVQGEQTGSTHTLVYTDDHTGKSNYQTVCVPTYGSQAPFILATEDDNTRILSRHGDHPAVDVRIHAVIGAASNHYYSRVDRKFNEVPSAVIASPRSSCAAGCSGCARGAIDSFSAPSRGYISEHVEELLADYQARGWDPGDLKSVNITTGSQPSEQKEVDMMIDIMDTYRRYGFTDAGFMIYNYALKSEEAMRAIRNAGALGYIGTIETMDDDLRRIHWGSMKGGQTFEEHLRRYETAHTVGFPIVETNYVVGLDPLDAMMGGIERLEEAGVVVVPNIRRSYNPEQLSSLHPDVWRHGFKDYVLEGFDRCLKTYQDKMTIKKYAGGAAVEWINKTANVADKVGSYTDLPIRHT